MTDPLGFISGSGAAQNMRQAAPQGPKAGEPSFKDVLLKNLDEVNQLQQDMSKAVEDLTTGKRHDPENVMLAAAKADNAFRALQAVRNKVMDAFDEIKQIRV